MSPWRCILFGHDWNYFPDEDRPWRVHLECERCGALFPYRTIRGSDD